MSSSLLGGYILELVPKGSDSLFFKSNFQFSKDTFSIQVKSLINLYACNKI